ncbi:sirohydrochlorin chelatase [Streptomyces sp. MST-110588]|nr:sirohydrochlorin chelatase [Streptomyces sp. MST-110588]
MTEIAAQLGSGLSRAARRYGLGRPAHPAGPDRTTRPDPDGAGAPAARRPVLVAVAHGSRDPRAQRTVRALLDRVRALRPGLDVRLGHIELNEPLLPDTLATLDGPAVLVPLLLTRGHHVTYDIPAASAAFPGLTARIAKPLGPHRLLARALHARLTEAGFPGNACLPGSAGAPGASGSDGPAGPPGSPGFLGTGGATSLLGRHPSPRPGGVPGRSGVPGRRSGACGPDGGPGPYPPRTAVVLAAAGSRVPESAADTARTARLLSARLGGVPVVPAYATAAPSVPEAVRALTARGYDRVAVASCFTAPGLFATQCATAAPWIASAPLGDHPALARLVLHRYDRASAAPTWCDLHPTEAATVAV